MANHLAQESSPYLLQHRDNPVDWYPWGPEALTRAQGEDRPILLSIGYAACHWCHVMEQESFEVEATAALMNEHFVCIKVDREERPDLDAIYMEAVQTMTGHGGWPMTVFLTPNGLPFYGGTYFPPEPRHGMPSFGQVLEAVADAWRQRRAEAESQGRQLMSHLGIAEKLAPSNELITEGMLSDAQRALREAFDPDYGGFGGAPKFPQAMTIDFLLRMHQRGHDEAGVMARKTLDAMSSGGMFDQLAGGFARYSVDRYWLVPHFEKMLYDNAQLLRTYARASTVFDDSRYREVAEMTAGWLLSEMRDERGGFFSSLDADSEGEEGKFYVFSLDDVRAATGEDLPSALAAFGFTEQGNFEGLNIPTRAAPAPEGVRRALLDHRNKRIRPETDDKVLAAWNGLAASALAEAGTLLGRTDWVEAAGRALGFVLETLRIDGRLQRSYRDGIVKPPAYCDDYAFVLEGCLALFQATFEPRWLEEARWAGDEALRLFADPVAGGFYSTGSDAEQLITRPKEIFDNALPSANSVLALELQKLAALTGQDRYVSAALGVLRLTRDLAARSPQGFGHLLAAVDFYTSTPAEVVVIGEPEAQDTGALLAALHSRYLPNAVAIMSSESEGVLTELPLLQGRKRIDGKATAFVCRHGTCKLPVTEPAALLDQLSAA